MTLRTDELAQLEQTIETQTEWDKYLACNPLPDVQVRHGRWDGMGWDGMWNVECGMRHVGCEA